MNSVTGVFAHLPTAWPRAVLGLNRDGSGDVG